MSASSVGYLRRRSDLVFDISCHAMGFIRLLCSAWKSTLTIGGSTQGSSRSFWWEGVHGARALIISELGHEIFFLEISRCLSDPFHLSLCHHDPLSSQLFCIVPDLASYRPLEILRTPPVCLIHLPTHHQDQHPSPGLAIVSQLLYSHFPSPNFTTSCVSSGPMAHEGKSMPFQHSLRAALRTNVTCTCVGLDQGSFGVMKTEMVPASPGWSGRMEGKREVGCWGECVQGVILGIEQGGPCEVGLGRR